MNSGSLAGIFRWLRSVIEEADKPFSLFITVILPIVAPIIPSIITSSNLQKYMEYTPGTALIAAVAFALVGYVSMVTAIGAIMNFVEQEKNRRVWLPVVITTGSYAVYVFALIMVNIVLEYNNGVSGDRIAVTALMTLGLEIPAALLNGTRINVRDRDEKKVSERKEAREERLERYKIKHGKVSENLPSETRIFQKDVQFSEIFRNFPKGDWRAVRGRLTPEQAGAIFNSTPEEARAIASIVGVTERTVSNWRTELRG